MTLNPVTAADAGCWIDSHHGQYATPMMLRIATERGWQGLNEAETAGMLAWLNSSNPYDDAEALSDEMFSRLLDAAEDAEQWLNDNVAPDGYSFGWHEGDFMLWDAASWED